MSELTVAQRIEAVRNRLIERHVDAVIIPSADPHLSEYVAPHWQARRWVSGFTGSAGTVVITAKEAGLWTDSRYFIQAEAQLQGSGITLFREGLPETPSMVAYLCANLPNATVGIDRSLFSVVVAEQLAAQLGEAGIALCQLAEDDLFDGIWVDRPALPSKPVEVYDMEFAGRSAAEKLADVRAKLTEKHADGVFISALDEVAWTLNLRGSDVHCNPVAIAYLLIACDTAVLFTPIAKVTEAVAAHLKEAGVVVHDYATVNNYLAQSAPATLLIEPARTPASILDSLQNVAVVRDASPVAMLKAVRNKTEIAGIHAAMRRDGVAMVRFLRWLATAVPEGHVTEISAAEKLQELRAEGQHYRGESFDTIAGYGEHAAIVHYSATPATNVTLAPRGLLLLDSGAQYLDGTTDITRTIALGPLTDEERLDYTLVLKGHIALATAHFPTGTRGAQLDALARMPLWTNGMNYLHGTGHGVGHYLNVHEGPQSIRMNQNPVPIVAGMVTSNEPGVYKAGSHGIRIENLVLACDNGPGMFGNYLKFETLTLCPIDTRPIIVEMLSETERTWLNRYHHHVYMELAPLLSVEECAWLLGATAEI